jgi:nucleoside-diphosphate-sugar epimerase
MRLVLARKHLGYEMQVDFREGLRRTVEWYKSTMKTELLAHS